MIPSLRRLLNSLAAIPTDVLNSNHPLILFPSAAIDTHLDDFFSASKELQDRLADISTTSHTSQSQQQLSEIDILERDVLCCVAELRRSEAMVTRHMEVVTKAVEVLEQADKANAPLTENLFAFKK